MILNYVICIPRDLVCHAEFILQLGRLLNQFLNLFQIDVKIVPFIVFQTKTISILVP